MTIEHESTRSPSSIHPRSPDLGLDASIPRHWFGGSAVATQVANGVNLLFPAGERFFVRSVHHFMDRIDDPVLRAAVKGFSGQEGRHAQAHERFFEVMKEQGYDVDGFLSIYQRIGYEIIEPRTSPELRLAVTVALEHFTAIMARGALGGGLLEHAHPAMRALLSWHAAEEIEHKSVAFDVLRAVNPSYGLRMRGLALACIVLGGFWIAATLKLLAEDGELKLGALRELRAMRAKSGLGDQGILQRVFYRGIRAYVARDFHPSQSDDAELAASYLASVGLS